MFGRGIDIERINLAINYDLPADADSYLHRVGRAGRFGTKGLSISFVSSEQDEEVLKAIEKRFEVALPWVFLFSITLYIRLLTLQQFLTLPFLFFGLKKKGQEVNVRANQPKNQIYTESFPKAASTRARTWLIEQAMRKTSGTLGEWYLIDSLYVLQLFVYE